MDIRKFRITTSWYVCPILEAETPLEDHSQLWIYGKDEIKGEFLEEKDNVCIVKILEINDKEAYWFKAEILKELIEFIE